ncbi:MAG: ABC transporter permease, partial [Clostridiales bacterium]|nr:ABC transporter permease [Clostridiales bacterium]
MRLFRLGLKNHIHSWRAFALWALLPLLLIAAGALALASALAGSPLTDRLSVVFCDLEGSPYFDIFMNMALADESVSKTVAIRELGYDDAIAALEAGRADAVAVFPETFIRDMMDGINQPVTVLFRDAGTMDAVLIKEFVSSAANEISATQSAINTAWRFRLLAAPEGAAPAGGSFADLVIKYALKAFSRKVIYSYRSISSGFGVSPLSFYLSSFLACYIFFGSALGIKGIIADRGRLIPDRLAASGLGPAAVSLCYFAPLLCSSFAGAAVAALGVFAVFASGGAALGFASKLLGGLGGAAGAAGPLGASGAPGSPAAGAAAGGGGQPAFDAGALLGGASVSAESLLACLAAIFCLCLFAAALSLFLGQAFRSSSGARFFVVTSGAVMAVLGGTLIPYPYLPDFFQTAGRASYSLWAQRLISSALFEGRLLPVPAAAFALLACLLFFASAAIFRMRAERAGGAAAAREVGPARAGGAGAAAAPGAPAPARFAGALPRFFAMLATRLKTLLRFRLNFAMLVLMPILAAACAWSMINFYFEGGKSIPVGILDFDGTEFSSTVIGRFGQNESVDARLLFQAQAPSDGQAAPGSYAAAGAAIGAGRIAAVGAAGAAAGAGQIAAVGGAGGAGGAAASSSDSSPAAGSPNVAGAATGAGGEWGGDGLTRDAALSRAELLVGNGTYEAVIVVYEGFSDRLKRSEPDGLLQIMCAPAGMTRGFVTELFISQVSRIYFNCTAAADTVAERSAAAKAGGAELSEAERLALFDDAYAYSDAFWYPAPLMTVNFESLASVAGAT